MPNSGSTNDDTFGRLEDQIAWYDRRSARQRRAFYLLKIVTIVAAAAIPVLAALPSDVYLNRLVTSSLGALIVIVEGTQQLFQLQTNWLLYRSACESLKREKYLYLANAGPYAIARDTRVLLAERIEALISQELGSWTVSQQSTVQGAKPGRPQDDQK
jgi:hypothetical protein